MFKENVDSVVCIVSLLKLKCRFVEFYSSGEPVELTKIVLYMLHFLTIELPQRPGITLLYTEIIELAA